MSIFVLPRSSTLTCRGLWNLNHFKFLSSKAPKYMTPEDFIKREERFGAENYKPLPVVIHKAQGVFMWDVQGKRYYDFHSANGAVNQGHCHPKIVKALQQQSEMMTLTSRNFYSTALGELQKCLAEHLVFSKMLPMSTGVEAGETACKMARRWGYNFKGIKPDKAKILFTEGNYWGSTMAAISSSEDPLVFKRFGPYMPGFDRVPYNEIGVLEEKVLDYNVCAVMVEPILDEAGVVVAKPGYLSVVKDICAENQVLMIVDETRTGLCRTGKMLGVHHHAYAQPDILMLGGSLGGGCYPVSAVLANDYIILEIYPGEHSSTFGGNPLACKVALAAFEVLYEENLAQNAEEMGKLLRAELEKLPKDVVEEVRGQGLLNAIVLHESMDPGTVCLRLCDKGLLVRPPRNQVIRLAPPLTITREQMEESIDIIKKSLL